MVIKADALHYKTDVYTNLAVLISLVLVNFTGFEIIDVIVGGGISLFIIYSAYELIQEGVLVLLDRAVDEETVNKIIENFSISVITSYSIHYTKLYEMNLEQ